MKRTHMHFAIGLPQDSEVISGMRTTCQVLIYLDKEKALKDGIKFYLSKNNVILTAGLNGSLHPKYFEKVIDKKTNKIIFTNEQFEQLEKQTKQPYDYILVLDFEAQCSKTSKLEVQEIIEFPVIAINLNDRTKFEQFHYYIKPTQIPILTDFCTELTGIQQNQVDNGITIEKALELFHQFLEEKKILNTNFCIATCGDWDISTCLKKECRYKKIALQPYMKRWINVKRVFNSKFGIQKVGMVEMLQYLDLKLDGRHHSGIDDTKNITKIVLKLLESININKSFESSY